MILSCRFESLVQTFLHRKRIVETNASLFWPKFEKWRRLIQENVSKVLHNWVLKLKKWGFIQAT